MLIQEYRETVERGISFKAIANRNNNGGIAVDFEVNGLGVPATWAKAIFDVKTGRVDVPAAEQWLKSQGSLQYLEMFMRPRHTPPIKAEGTKYKRIVQALLHAFRHTHPFYKKYANL